MARNVIEILNLGKQYRLGQVGRSSIADDFKRLTHRLRGKEDPFLQIGEENDRTKKGNSDYVWALKDISFNVQQGNVLGIIGKNGAGKSTLLKILSRTTSPTIGEYKIKGRVASLLEVGTGFHPDLTGRENVFLNGALLGMTKAEIKKNFDEILDFSGVERYIDTPVKRYSSGMYVRLAFAVAAHLDPEILIVDEVLAVGDQEFQDKCLGKMRSVSEEGRTVLFVSHNLMAVKQLCTSGIFMKNGTIKSIGTINETIEEYLNDGNIVSELGDIPREMKREYSNGEGYFNKIALLNLNDVQVFSLAFNQPFKVKLQFEALQYIEDAIFNINICNTIGEPILYAVEKLNGNYSFSKVEKGITEIEVVFDIKLLPNNYKFTIGVGHKSGLTIDYLEGIFPFKVNKIGYEVGMDYPWDISNGYVEPETKWNFKKI
ncbi:MAG: ABC transporter ATP-binding protein [Bacteroidetes bacterium]|nr:ABC transporter ATP-binding protein [Bacteroidota bacterium]